MLDPRPSSIVDLAAAEPPRLVVVVDTEEEFDWNTPFSRDNTSVDSVRHQQRAHRLYHRHGIRPVYVVDYPVASQEAGYRPLRELLDDGLCEIGAHLHPWVNPPFDEEVGVVNSYPGNLPRALEYEKLRRLGAMIEDSFAVRPTVYKAGRYGVGPATAGILAELGYEIDTSVVPRTDMRRDHGPDFSRCGARPYRFGPGDALLELPLTVGFSGLLAGFGPSLFPLIASRPGRHLHLPGIFARLSLLERIRLTPEGIVLAELRRLTKALLATGHRVFCLAFHSPSLAPGHTPYVRNEADLDRFLAMLDSYFDYFIGELGGVCATASEIKALLAAPGAG